MCVCVCVFVYVCVCVCISVCRRVFHLPVGSHPTPEWNEHVRCAVAVHTTARSHTATQRSLIVKHLAPTLGHLLVAIVNSDLRWTQIPLCCAGSVEKENGDIIEAYLTELWGSLPLVSAPMFQTKGWLDITSFQLSCSFLRGTLWGRLSPCFFLARKQEGPALAAPTPPPPRPCWVLLSGRGGRAGANGGFEMPRTTAFRVAIVRSFPVT
jgi:hypothetical protein